MAEVEDRTGNIFESSCDVLTVTVNCEGVMGAGIALAARMRWPTMFERYQTLCNQGLLQPGVLWLWEDRHIEPSHRVLCFPTKNRWRMPSRLSYVDEGLEKLASTYRERGIHSIAMPHLGCSHGGLQWHDVRQRIVGTLEGCVELRVEMWEYDAQAPDPNFDRLTRALANLDASKIAALLGLRVPQVAALVTALASPHVTGLSTLQEAPGVGERTLERVYEYLFRRHDDPPRQQELF